MQRGLMLFCKKKNTAKCKLTNIEISPHGKIDPGISFRTPQEIIEFDQVCESCEISAFEIKEQECPVCGNKELEFIGEISFGPAGPTIHKYIFRCISCPQGSRDLYSAKDFRNA